MTDYGTEALEQLKQRNPDQPEFLQAASEVITSLQPVFEKHPEYRQQAILQRLTEPERAISFKVELENDQGGIEIYRGYRVQFNSAIGPYKGGLRFHPSVNLSIMKFLGFEQIFKNALTTLPIGGAKGGSNFDPKKHSEAEVRRFCQSFMTSLYRFIGPDMDVPAGDMGVGGREIGYLYGQYRRLTGQSVPGILTGKGLTFGGSLARTEATGYGLIYMLQEVLKQHPIDNPRLIISGSGNVAIYAAVKALASGYQVVAMSDSLGYIIDEQLDIETIRTIKEKQRGSLAEYPKLAGHGTYYPGSVYDAEIACNIVLPCATQNEINLKRAQNIVKNGAVIVAEGANMPDNNEAIAYYQQNGIIFVPGKAANAGGVATSALEMSQNSQRLSWSFEEVDNKLKGIMQAIHAQCQNACQEYGLPETDYVAGANIAGANKVIKAMLSQGIY